MHLLPSIPFVAPFLFFPFQSEDETPLTLLLFLAGAGAAPIRAGGRASYASGGDVQDPREFACSHCLCRVR
jgi:hypothetical protein